LTCEAYSDQMYLVMLTILFDLNYAASIHAIE
jgi:hypothetical protein